MNTTPYATDEDIALRAASEFLLICPTDQAVAFGDDGLLASIDRWSLSSNSVDFQSQGARPGQIVTLNRPQAAFRSPGEQFAIERVQGNSLRLRRRGQPADAGHPPSPSNGREVVEFTILTLDPQIESASYELNRRFGIGRLAGSNRVEDLVDPRELREAVVLTVLHRRYLDLSRSAEGGKETFAAKALVYKSELDEHLARLAVHFLSNSSLDAHDSKTRFHTRITR